MVAQAVAVKAVNRVIVRKKMTKLDQVVIDLHDIARQVEKEIGQGQLSIDIRKCADRLNILLKPTPQLANTAKGDQ